MPASPCGGSTIRTSGARQAVVQVVAFPTVPPSFVLKPCDPVPSMELPSAAATRMRRAQPIRGGRWEPTRRWCGLISTPPVPGVVHRRIWSPSPPGRSSAPPRRLQGAPSNDKDGAADGDREALGRSRGGLSTKIHLAADDRCRPIAQVITAGHDVYDYGRIVNSPS